MYMFICIYLLNIPIKIAGYATNGPKLLDLMTQLLLTAYYLTHFNQISSAVGVFGDTLSSSSDAIATPIVSY